MKELLVDNVEPVEVSPWVVSSWLARPHLHEVSSLSTWCYCFMRYMAAQTSDPVIRDQLAYALPSAPCVEVWLDLRPLPLPVPAGCPASRFPGSIPAHPFEYSKCTNYSPTIQTNALPPIGFNHHSSSV